MRRGFVVIAVAVLLVGGMHPSEVSAHSDFSGSEPDPGSTVDGPLSSVAMNFALSVSAQPGFGFFVDGEPVEAVWTAEDADRTTWIGVPSGPVSSGEVQVTYAVTADDGHLVDGQIAFSVLPAEAPTTTILELEVTQPTVVSSTTPESTSPEPVNESSGSVLENVRLETSEPAIDIDHVARAFSLLGTAALLGMIVFTTIVLRSGVLGAFVLQVMVAAATVGLASLIEVMSLADRMELGVDEVVGDSLARGLLLRAVGSLLVLLAGLSLRSGSPAPAISIIGAVLVLMSFAFDGHSVTLGWRPLHGLTTITHVGVAALWVGSVLGVGLISRTDPKALPMVLKRLVQLLPVAVGLLVVTGVVMTVLIHGWTLNLLDSSWGKILLVKLSLVAVGGAFGWKHHRRSQSGSALRQWSITAEVVLLLAVPIVTSWLVVSMP